jgi:hypothetical protein
MQYAAYYNTTATALATSQWTNCAVVPGSVGGTPSSPAYPELCGYALNVAYPPFTLQTLPPESLSSTILTEMIGGTTSA